MLPFEDRYSRQRRLPEVGADGQRRLQSHAVVLGQHDGSETELEYLTRAGVSVLRVDSEAHCPDFPFAGWFEFAAPGSVARGAWSALCRIRSALAIERET